jgi:nicotinate-nucleotide pyrophosphorylase (carboxylating)
MRAPPPFPPPHTWRPLLEWALAEDLGPGDATTPLLIPAGREGEAVIEARQPLVVCGLSLAAAVFETLDPGITFAAEARDGEQRSPGEPLARIFGSLRSLLAAERTALNFLGRLCGVASFTRRFVDTIAGTGCALVDTRKTLPGWRSLDKYAAAVGGAVNHRMGLYDGILLKDNHVAAAGGTARAVKAALAAAPASLRVQVEVESEAEALEAIDAGADSLLLDNRSLEELRRIVARVAGRAILEASGGIHLENVRAVAETGVQRISVGALTHSAPVADVAMELCGAASLKAPRRGDGL